VGRDAGRPVAKAKRKRMLTDADRVWCGASFGAWHMHCGVPAVLVSTVSVFAHRLLSVVLGSLSGHLESTHGKADTAAIVTRTTVSIIRLSTGKTALFFQG
jgi:hypothetical protein